VARRLTEPERGRHGTFAALEPLELDDGQRRAPRPPAWLPESALASFRRLYRNPVAQLWQRGDVDLVARLAVYRSLFEAGDVRGTTSSAIARLEEQLLLSPRARRAARITIRPAPAKPAREQPAEVLALARRVRGNS
jgi:hypothetical protein